MTRLLLSLMLVVAVGAGTGCTRSPERRAASGEWVGEPTDHEGRPILPPSYMAPHIQGCQP
jgi:hypothetical protein